MAQIGSVGFKILRYEEESEAGIGFRRFSLRGIDKTTTEFGLMALAHNL